MPLGAITVRVATRASPLARWQADHVIELLRRVEPRVEPVIVAVDTAGDRHQHVPIHAMGGKGVFVKEVQAAVLDGRADIAVHSAKDLPSSTLDGLVLAAVPERGDPRDALVGCRLADLAPGATVATGSIRRRAQLAAARPDLCFAELRGNIATRLAKASQFDAIAMAVVALERLGEKPTVVDVLPVEALVPQVGQGALAVEARSADPLVDMVRPIEHPRSRRAVDAERAFLAELGGDCDIPAGAHAVAGQETVEIRGLIAMPDGSEVAAAVRSGRDAEIVGRSLARHLLDDLGGASILAAVANS